MHKLSAEQVKQTLLSTIDSLLDQRDLFLNNPERDFTKIQKISFRQAVLFPFVAGSDTLESEIAEFFRENSLPFPSAMIYRRNQIKPEAFMELFHRFNSRIHLQKNYFGYQIACYDGSRLNLPYNPSDPYTFIKCIENRKGINQLHMNCLYDPLNDIFLDVELQGIHEMDEKNAFTRSLDKHKDDGASCKRIYIADRGYASYNIFAHAIRNKQLFLIRVPESFAKSVCTDNPNWLDSSHVDKEVTIHIGRRRTKEHLKLQNYHCIPTDGHYDFIEAKTDRVDQMQLRILKFPISEDTFEYIITNLQACSFSMKVIKNLYEIRWKEEVAFRHLKYAGNMVHIHSLKKEFLIQEIYAKLTLYNFSSYLAGTSVEIKPKVTKYRYVINHTQMQKNCIRFLRGLVEDVEKMISRSLVPIRPDRKFTRNLRRQSADTLNYR